jgi:hypothetical protein
MVDMRDQKQFFCNAQMEDIRSALLLEDTPAPDDSLSYCRSLRTRRRLKTPTQLQERELLKLREWLSHPASSILLAQGQGVRTSAVDFATDFLDAAMEKGFPVLWALPSSAGEGGTAAQQPSLRGILRSLVLQALGLDSSALRDGVNPIRMQHLRKLSSAEQLFKILERCLESIPRLIMVIDTGIIETAVDRNGEDMYNDDYDDGREFPNLGRFVQRVSDMVQNRDKGGLKVVMVSWRFRASASLDASDVFDDEQQIYTDGGRRMERMMRQPKHRAVFKRRNERLVSRLKSAIGASDTGEGRYGVY